MKEDHEHQSDRELLYDDVPRNKRDEKEDLRLEMLREWHKMLGRPEGLNDTEYAAFTQFAMGFVMNKDRLWQKHSQGYHQLVLPKER